MKIYVETEENMRIFQEAIKAVAAATFPDVVPCPLPIQFEVSVLPPKKDPLADAFKEQKAASRKHIRETFAKTIEVMDCDIEILKQYKPQNKEDQIVADLTVSGIEHTKDVLRDTRKNIIAGLNEALISHDVGQDNALDRDCPERSDKSGKPCLILQRHMEDTAPKKEVTKVWTECVYPSRDGGFLFPPGTEKEDIEKVIKVLAKGATEKDAEPTSCETCVHCMLINNNELNWVCQAYMDPLKEVGKASVPHVRAANSCPKWEREKGRK